MSALSARTIHAADRPPRVAHVTTVDLSLRFLLLSQLCRLRDEGFEVTGISAPGPWVTELEAEGIRHIAWPHATRAWDPRSDARAFAELVGIFRREGFDLVHTHNPKPGILGRVAARLAGVPCVVNTVHGLYATPEDPARKRIPVLALERMAAAFSDLELYQSEEDLAWAKRIRLAGRSKARLLGNGCNLSELNPGRLTPGRVAERRLELGIPQDAVVVGMVGRLVAEKGYRELFAAAREVRERAPHVRFLVVGERDPEKADVIGDEEMVAAGDGFIFAGWRKDVPDLLALMDIFVLPSWREGLPRSAIEAAAMGKPMVLTDIRGCREVARDGMEAILIPPRDPERLAEAISLLVADPALRAALGAAARFRARERFDERTIGKCLVTHYRDLLARRALLCDSPGAVRIRPAVAGDASGMARLHRDSLPGAFLPSLGERFLRGMYRVLADDREAVAFVATDGEKVVGFAAGVTSVRGFYRRFFRRHGLAAGLAAAPRLVRPKVLRRVIETASYPTGSRSLPDAELLAIAVAPEARARGVGRELAEEVLGRLAGMGTGDVKVVVGAANEGANRFYGRLGFQPSGQIAIHRGTPSNVWILPCRSSSLSG